MTETISVVIPVFNDTQNLDKCLASIYDTEYKNLDVIVVDDASDDSPSEVTRRYPCECIRLPENRGQAYARNIGAEKAKGDIILFTDSDCAVMRDWASRLSEELIRAHEESRKTVAVCGRLVSGKGFFEMSHSYAGYAYIQGGPRRFMDYLNSACVAVYKEAFKQVGGFSVDMRTSEDPELALKLVEKGFKVMFEPSVLVVHNHGIRTFRQLVIKHRNWGQDLGLTLQMRHKRGFAILLFLLSSPLIHFLLIVPIAFLTTAKIIMYNIRLDKKILLYATFIFISKVYFRWGIFIKSIRVCNDSEKWKRLDRHYHEDTAVVASYDKKITKKYYLEHKYFTYDKWTETLEKAKKHPILDCGCGTGEASLKLLRRGIKTISLDASTRMLEALREKARKEQLDSFCVAGDVENLPFKAEVFEGLICAGALHHIPDIGKGIKNQVRVLKKGSLLFISEPFRHKLWFSYFYYIPVIIARFLKGLFRWGKASPQERPITRRDLESILAVLQDNDFEHLVSYFTYWPVVCGYLPERIAYPLMSFLNEISRNPDRGDSVIITARKL